jgi:hypothetical protein
LDGSNILRPRLQSPAAVWRTACQKFSSAEFADVCCLLLSDAISHSPTWTAYVNILITSVRTLTKATVARRTAVVSLACQGLLTPVVMLPCLVNLEVWEAIPQRGEDASSYEYTSPVRPTIGV